MLRQSQCMSMPSSPAKACSHAAACAHLCFTMAPSSPGRRQHAGSAEPSPPLGRGTRALVAGARQLDASSRPPQAATAEILCVQAVDAKAETHAALKAAPQHLRAPAYIHVRLAELGAKYAAMKRADRQQATSNS